eukprot:1161156-Pelagomonas_calceolata.AAC.4
MNNTVEVSKKHCNAAQSSGRYPAQPGSLHTQLSNSVAIAWHERHHWGVPKAMQCCTELRKVPCTAGVAAHLTTQLCGISMA